MFTNDLKVKVEEKIGDFGTDFIIYYQDGNNISYIKPLGEFVMEKYEPGKKVEPTFSLQSNEARAFIKEMAELAEKLGIKTEQQEKEEARTHGVLNATKYHLEDMRKLVFKKDE